jgi:hypothetical protein
VTSNATDLRTWAQSLRGHLPPTRQANPPDEQGERLATLERPQDDSEIRICWCEYQGSPYLGVRVWSRGHDGKMWPQKDKGFSVRLRELPDVAEAITRAMELADRHLAGATARNPRPARQPARTGEGFD